MRFLDKGVSVPEYRPPSAWQEHGPFAVWLVKLLQPRMIVELGSHFGYSYFCFCQAVVEDQISANCIAVDTWKGDEHAGFYDQSVYDGVVSHNTKYQSFSRLLRKTFDEALSDVEDGSVDLLHIDGRHYYEDVKSDFHAWLPKLSASAVVLFHDTEVRDRGFGVYKLWAEVSSSQLAINFRHGCGLGILFLGEAIPLSVRSTFFSPGTSEPLPHIEEYFGTLGELMKQRFTLDDVSRQSQTQQSAIADLQEGFDALQGQLHKYAQEIETLRAELRERSSLISLSPERESHTSFSLHNLGSTIELLERRTRFYEEQAIKQSRLLSDLLDNNESVRAQAVSLEPTLLQKVSITSALESDIAEQRDLVVALDHESSDPAALLSSIEGMALTMKTKREIFDKKLLPEVYVRAEIERIAEAIDVRVSVLSNKLEDTTRNQKAIRQMVARVVSEIMRTNRKSQTLGALQKLRWLVQYWRTSGSCDYSNFCIVKSSGLFDENYYLETYRDVSLAGLDPVWHYLTSGAAEGRNPSPLFCENAYQRLYEDVRSAGIPGLLHFERFGRDEGRRCPSVLEEFLDVVDINLPELDVEPNVVVPAFTKAPEVSERVPPVISDPRWEELEPLIHNNFDAGWYKKAYPDLGKLSDREALEHFLRLGSAELRNPNSHFDSLYYLRANPDTRGANPFSHFLLYGRFEGRQPKLFGINDLVCSSDLLGSIYQDRETRRLPSLATKANRICCLVHIYYVDLADELLSYVDNVKDEKDIYINLVNTTWSVEVHQKLSARYPQATIIVSQDHGRDIGGFARLLSMVDISIYDIFLLIHSKKSPHLSPEAGVRWRRELLDPIIGTSSVARLCVSEMRINSRMGLIGAAKWRCKDVTVNGDKYQELLDIACVPYDNRHCDFVSGTMFFIAQPIIKRLQLVLRRIVFEDGHDAPLSFHVDGQYAHAVERLIGNLVLDEGMFIWYK